MRRPFIFLLAFIATVISCRDKELANSAKRCIAAENHAALIKTNPKVQATADSIEQNIEAYYKRFNTRDGGEASLRGGRLIIPVVVHVLFNNSTTDPTNVPEARIDEQIARLNLDFRRLNADIGSVPGAFSTLAADSRIEFQRCQRDPSCNPTSGIVRKMVTATSFVAHDAKFNSTGGDDAWDTRKYLNIWVVPNLCIDATHCGFLGASSFPSDPLNEYGFVTGFRFLGNTTDPEFNLGRTATHEFGHFFNLIHIWGDDTEQPPNGVCNAPRECNGTDLVDDTPNQGEMNFHRPIFPHTDCCTSTSPGVMFMNYMDYVDDDAMLMFSQGQVDRMVATLYTTQAGLLSSDALIPPAAGSTPDLFVKDTPEDIGNEPNNESTEFYVSEDIWVRNSNDGTMNQEHVNPIYRPSGPSNYVYVRVRNRGCAPAASANVHLYWAKASSGLGWPSPWTGGVTVGTAVMGGEIGTAVASGSVAGGSSTILEFAWSPPNPMDYAAFGADNAHFCLLATVEPYSTAMADLGQLVKNNNNIAWKNVEVATSGMRAGSREATTLLANYNKEKTKFSLGFFVPKREESAFSYGDVYVKLSPLVYKNWKVNGSKGTNIEEQQDGTIRLLNVDATIDNISLKYRQIEAMKITFVESEKLKKLGPHIYFFDVKQFYDKVSPETFVGAQRIWVKSLNRRI